MKNRRGPAFQAPAAVSELEQIALMRKVQQRISSVEKELYPSPEDTRVAELEERLLTASQTLHGLAQMMVQTQTEER